MCDYQPQLDYPKDYSTDKFDDGFDLNDCVKVKKFIDEVIRHLREQGKIGPDEDAQKASGIIEGILEEDLSDVANRTMLLMKYVVENYERARQTHGRIVRGLADLKNKAGR